MNPTISSGHVRERKSSSGTAESGRIWVPQVVHNLGLVAIGFGVLMFLCSLALDWALLRHHEGARITIMISDGLLGCVAAVLVYRMLQYGRERRRMIEQRLHTISEMNHHIRNALQVISFSAHSARSQKELAEITDSVNRIQWALREILPKLEPSFETFEGSAKEHLKRS